jgi:hypothetical protein
VPFAEQPGRTVGLSVCGAWPAIEPTLPAAARNHCAARWTIYSIGALFH